MFIVSDVTKIRIRLQLIKFKKYETTHRPVTVEV
jgi:hypothetical protein